MSKDQWIIECEKIGERLIDEELSVDEAVGEWMGLGLDKEDAEKMAKEAFE